jgi:hypothetical protein
MGRFDDPEGFYAQAAGKIRATAFRYLIPPMRWGADDPVPRITQANAVRIQLIPGDGSLYDVVMVRLQDGMSVHVASHGDCAWLPFDPGGQPLHWLYVHEKLSPHNEMTSRAVHALHARAQAAVAELTVPAQWAPPAVGTPADVELVQALRDLTNDRGDHA